jgi:rhomboid protease GluP
MAKCAQCGRQLPPLSFGKKICQWCAEYEAMKRGDVSEDAPQKVMPVAWTASGSGRLVTQILVGVNVAVFIAMAMAGVSLTEPTIRQLLVWGANAGPFTFGGQWWRLITYMFVHGGVFHIVFNLWCLWDLGILCENLYGPWMYLAIYFLSGIAGGLGSVAWHPINVSVGASGAIFGLAGALIASFKLGEFSLPAGAISGLLRNLLIFVVINVIWGFASSITDNGAHLGGLLMGAIMGALVAVVSPDSRRIGRRTAVVVLSCAVVGAAWALLYRLLTRG